MKKTYSSPVTRVIQIRHLSLMAGSAKGGYKGDSMINEGTEKMSRRNWSFNDDDEY